jgi:hypothetical protein
VRCCEGSRRSIIELAELLSELQRITLHGVSCCDVLFIRMTLGHCNLAVISRWNDSAYPRWITQTRYTGEAEKLPRDQAISVFLLVLQALGTRGQGNPYSQKQALLPEEGGATTHFK